MTLLNLGCGNRYLPGWVNIDFVSGHPQVDAHDLSKGVPMPDESCDVVYHSHVLEHFSRSDGRSFMAECFRVLRQGGIIRVAVPDLEGLAKQYLTMLGQVTNNDDDLNKANYEWSVIEMIDQMVRARSGGEMMEYWMQPDIINESIVEARLGHEFTQWRHAFLNRPATSNTARSRYNLLDRLKQKRYRQQLSHLNLTDATLQQARFQQSGEKHQWMYDRYSLKALFTACGFKDVQHTNAFSSAIKNWALYQELDVENGKPRKPDSLFMEAIKPISV